MLRWKYFISTDGRPTNCAVPSVLLVNAHVLKSNYRMALKTRSQATFWRHPACYGDVFVCVSHSYFNLFVGFVLFINFWVFQNKHGDIGLDFFLLSLYVSLIASFYFYVRSCVYFTFSTIAMSLLLSHDLHVRLLGLHVVQKIFKYSIQTTTLMKNVTVLASC